MIAAGAEDHRESEAEGRRRIMELVRRRSRPTRRRRRDKTNGYKL